MGRNNVAAWGLTLSYSDCSDFYEETLRGNKYFHNGKWHKMQERKEVIKIKNKKDLEFVVKYTHHGPLLDAAFVDSDPKIIHTGKSTSFAWAALK
jgi:penicillin amidase